MTAAIPFSRLVRVEWAKATDTRAARWLLALVVVTTAALMVVPVVSPTAFRQSHTGYLGAAAIGLTILLPVVAILLLTTEWSQRSVMTTFTQEPRRLLVVGAKVAVSTLLGVGASVVGAAITAIAVVAASASGRTVAADLNAGVVVGYVAFVLLNVLGGVALGALLQNSGTAIAASFALPAGFAVAGTASKWVSEWIDMSSTWKWVLENRWDGHVPQILFSISVWVVIPLAAGVVRTVRRDVS